MSHGIVARYEHRRGHGNERKPLRRESKGRQCATMSPGACSSALRWYIQRTESPLHSGLVGRAPATLEKRIPINSWAEVLEQNPDPKVVTDADFLKRITETRKSEFLSITLQPRRGETILISRVSRF